MTDLLDRIAGSTATAVIACALLIPAGTSAAQTESRSSAADTGRIDRPRDGRRTGGRYGRLLRPDLVRRDMSLIAEELRLDEPQGDVVETLLLDYETAFDEAAAAMRERLEALRPRRELSREMREVRETMSAELRELRQAATQLREQGEAPDSARLQKMAQRQEALRTKLASIRPSRPQGEELQTMVDAMTALFDEWSRQRDRLKDEFMLSLHAILNEEQAEQLWPGFERALRRRKSMNRGELSGESVDLFLVLNELGLGADARESLEPVMEDYARALDPALVARDAFLEEERAKVFQAMRTGDTELALLLMTDEASLRSAVRDVNRQYAAILADTIGEQRDAALAATLMEQFRRRAFPRVFRPTTTERAFDVIDRLDDLDPAARRQIDEIQLAYDAEIGPVNERIIRLTVEHEPQRKIRWVKRRQESSDGVRDDPIRSAYEDRLVIDIRYRRLLEGLLPPEQAAMLPAVPEPRERDERRNGRRRGRDDRRRGSDA